MNAISISVLVSLTGLSDGPAAIPPPRPAASVAKPSGAKAIAFEIRTIAVSSPDWRGRLVPFVEPLGQQESSSAWSLNGPGLKQFLEECQADSKVNVLQAPKMVVRVGEPARMTNEVTEKYIASLKRVADGAPGASGQLAFQPQVGEIHNGVRVNILSSKMQDGRVQAQVAVEENRILGIYTTTYTEKFNPASNADPGVVRTSFVDRIKPNPAAQSSAVRVTMQVPEVESRRIEGQWQIPADGALLVSMGPRPGHEKSLRKGYAELLVAITARPTDEEPQKPASSFPEGARDRVRTVIPGKPAASAAAPR